MSRRLLMLGWHNIDPTPFYPAAPGAGRRGFARRLTLVGKLGTVVPLEAARRGRSGAIAGCASADRFAMA